MRIFSTLLFVLLITNVEHSLAQQYTKLSKIFHHTKNSKDPYKSVQLGGVTFVFSNDLVVNQLPVKGGTKTRLRFFVPEAILQPSIKDMHEIKSPQGDAYKIQISKVSSPKNGIQFDLEYDSGRVVFARDMFQRVTRERKLVFHFYDKHLLDTIKTKAEVPMIVHAALNPSVIIDCGHGGHDFGVVGCANAAEKNICLAVGKKVAVELKKKGIRAVLTRDDDTYVSLDNRVREINNLNPQLFVSIHANAAYNKNISGVETYYFDRSVCSVQKDVNSDTKYVHEIVDVYQKVLTAKNKLLAQNIQQAICKEIMDNNMAIVDRKIKSEPLQLLMGAMVPSALIEIGFLTNEQEANLLLQDEYQLLVANGICNGIMMFV